MDPQMNANSSPFRPVAIAVVFSLGTLCAAPAQAFSDDEARRAILDLRAQVQQLTTQNQQARLQFADQLETLKQQVATMRGQLEKLQWESDIKNRSSQDQSGGTNTLVSDPKAQSAYK